jgi:ABC-2 type transport system permease protein
MLLVLALVMSGTFAVPTLLVEEKEKHTLDVLLVSPASAVDVVVGKGLVGLVYCALASLALIVLNRGWQGAWPLTFLGILIGSAFAVLVGLLIGGLFRTMSQVNTWSSLVMLVLILPTWFTLASDASPIATVIRLIPTFYLAEALGLSLAGNWSVGRIAADLAIVAACAVAALVGVVWLLRREER